MLENFFRNIPPVVKNLLIINILMFMATLFYQPDGEDLRGILGLFHFKSPLFEPYQIVTYMFMHGDFTHLLFNMFSLVMFGTILEQVWGPKRFLLFYFVTGIGAVLLYQLVALYEYNNYLDSGNIAAMRDILFTPMVGASGALFGVMTAFGVLFPNTEMMLIFFPIPIKAKYFIPFMILMELYLGVMQYSGDNVAHFAHLGGAVIGFILLKFWQKKKNNFY